ncbi:MAG: hypothetical protein KW802_01755 [Candidatus Doudnabacteria bacterium]|nr:hypothetical protein [Candidatus Doudnabacteria bacterium]
MWFKLSPKDKALANLLKRSAGDFNFDETSAKFRLLASINRLDQKPAPSFHITRVMWYSTAFAALVITASTTFAFASNALPGDKLFALNKFGEKVILTLPLPVEQKAKVQEYIVTNRLEALDKVDTEDLETVKESDESLMTAVDAITQNKTRLESMGKTKQAETLEKVLDQLQTKVENKENTIKEIEKRAKDEPTREKIREHLKKIEDSKQKARLHIKRFQNQEGQSHGQKPEQD